MSKNNNSQKVDDNLKQLQYCISTRHGKILYIVIHDTDNKGKGADADAHFRYFNSGNHGASADFFVDDTQILQANDYHKFYTWQCNGRKKILNKNSIGIEICVNSDGHYEKAVANTIELVKRLMKELNIPIERVVRHNDASGKICPKSMSKNNWADWYKFKEKLVESKITVIDNKDKDDEEVIYKTINDVPHFWREDIKRLILEGAIKGDGKGNINLPESTAQALVIMLRHEDKRK